MSNKSRFPGYGGSNRDDEDDDDDKGRPASGGSRPNSFNRGSSDKPGAFGSRSPFNRPGDDEEDDEDDDKSKSKFGSNRPSSFGSKSPFSKPGDDDEEDEEDEERVNSPKSGFGSRPGSSGFGSKPPSSGFGSKPGDKPGDKSSTGTFGASKQPFGSKSNEPAKPGSSSSFGGKPASNSPFGSKSNEPAKPGSSSPFGSKSNEPAKPGSGSSFGSKTNEPAKPGSSFGSKPASNSPFGSKTNEPAKSGSGSPFGSKSNEPAKPGSSSPFGSKLGDKKDEKVSDKKDEKPSGGGLFGGGAKLPFGGGGSKPGGKPGDKKDDKPSGGGLFGGAKLPFGGGGSKPADKKDDKSTGGGFGSKMPFGGNKAPDKKDDKPAPTSSFGAPKQPFGSKPGDKPGDKSSTGTYGAAKQPFGGKPGDKPADKKDERSAGGGLFGSKLPFGGKPADKPADKKDDKAAAASKPAGGLLGGRLPFGGKQEDKTADTKRATSSVSAPPKTASTAADAKKTGSKVPPARGEKVAKPLDRSQKQLTVRGGLSLDQKLDLVGYALIISGLLILFGIIQPSEGSITKAIADLLGGLFGYGRIILPIPCLAIGLWLFVRHFNENPLVITAHRAAGWIIMFLTFITTAQWLSILPMPNIFKMSDLIKASDAVAKAQQGGGWVGGQIYKILEQVAGDWGVPVLLVGFWLIAIMLALSITLAELTIYGKSVFTWMGRVRRNYVERRVAAAQAKAAAAPAITIENPANATPASATLAAPAAQALNAGRNKQKAIPEKTGEPEAVPVGGSPRLAAPAATATATAASANAGSMTRAPFGKPPGATAVQDEVAEDEEIEKEQAPALRPAPAPLGSRPATGGDGKDKSEPAKASPFGSVPAKASTVAKPAPFGAKPGAATAEPEDEDEDEQEAAPIVKPSPLSSRPGSPAPIGQKTAQSTDQTKTEEKSDDKEASAPDASKPASSFGAKPASPFGSKPGATPAAKPGASPFAKPGDDKDEDEDDEPEDKADVKTSDALKPASPFGANRPSPFGSKPDTTPVAKPGDDKDEEEDAAPEDKADVKTADASKPASPFGANRPSPFGSKPGATPAAKPGGSPFAKPGDDKDDDVDELEDKADVKTADASKPASPFANRPSPFGSRPGATPAATPGGSPFAKPGDDKDDDVDELEDKTDVKTADASKPASPFGNRPSPFGSKPGATPVATPGANPFAKPGDDKDDDVDELEDKTDVKTADASKPASPFGNRPSPFGSKPDTMPAAKPGGSPFAKPGDNKDDDEDTEPEDKTDVKTADASKPASPFGANRPSPFGSKPGATLAAKPASSPFAKPSDDDEDEDTEPEDKVDDKSAEPMKPATPMGNRPPLPAGSPLAPVTPRPVPKPGLATQPKFEEEEDEDTADPKYVDVDELDDLPRSNGPRPTVAGQVGTPQASMPRPANPVLPRQRPGENTTSTPISTATPATAPAGGNGAEKPAAKVETATPAPAVPTSTASPAAATPAVKPPESKPVISQPAAHSAPPLEGVILRGGKMVQGWQLPDFHELLEAGSTQKVNDDVLQERAHVIEETLKSFGAPGNVVEINPGPVITQFGVEPDYLVSRQGKKTRVKVSAISKLDADLALALAARSIRIEAPVPGKGYVGIEVPNAETALVSLHDIMDSEEFLKIKSKLRIALGQSVDGAPIAADLTQMPHLLIAGTTGSGKSVCVNAIISSLLLENSPDDLKMIMVDPKRVELTGYNGIPHLVSPVVVDLERIVGVLKWVTREMDERYKKFSQAGARNISDYNGRIGPSDPKLPYLVVVVDELADLMMLAPEETEKVLTRLAQMARATGIHLIVSTQRPSVDVVTGLIKANFPARISFAVASSVDSRVILDQPGAEKLLGRGDMLYQSPDAAAPLRMQGVYVSDAEINRITKYWKSTRYEQGDGKAGPVSSLSLTSSPLDNKPADAVQSRSERFGTESGQSQQLFGSLVSAPPNKPAPSAGGGDASSDDDEMYDEAVDLVKRFNKASISLLQRRLRIGYTRAARLIELMQQRGVVGAADSSGNAHATMPSSNPDNAEQ